MKTMPYQRSLRDLKSIHTARISSIPKQQRSVHLDLYVLANEKKRMEKELFQLQMKMKPIKKRLAQANKHIQELIKGISLAAGDGVKNEKSGRLLAPLIKKMRLSY